MEVSARQKWLTISLLAVVIPIGLLATLRLTEVLREPQTIAETIEMETVTLEFDRPFKGVKAPAIANGYVDGNVLINVSMPSIQYSEQGAVGNRDCVETNLWINATALQGFVHSVEFSCNVDDLSWIWWIYDPHRDRFYNATLIEQNETANWIQLSFKASNSPAAIPLLLDWIFFEGDGSADHQLSLSVSIVQYNGTAYRKVIIPLRIKITRDVGNTFEDAKLIVPSERIGSLDSVDRIDVYALHLQEGETINATLIPHKDSDFNLYLYNQNREELDRSSQRGNQTETITYPINETGTYYIKLELLDWPGHWGEGIYQLKIRILEVWEGEQ